MQRKRRNISFRDVGHTNGVNEDIANPTNAAWWTSQNRALRAVILNRSSQVVMAAYGGMTRYPRKVFSIIPCLSLIFLLLLGVGMVSGGELFANSAYATNNEVAITMGNGEIDEEFAGLGEDGFNVSEYDAKAGISTHTATAALTIDNNAVSSDGSTTITDSVTVAPGAVGYSKEYTIEVNVNDISDYTLTISGPTNLTGPNGATTPITGAGGKAGSSMTDNTWGYGFGSTSIAKESLIYNTLSTTGTNLATIDTTLPTVGSNDGSGNGSNITFSRKLVFAAKFGATNNNSGTYSAKITLSLVATPKTATDLSGVTYMQELDGHPEICTNTPFMSEDVKYSKEYILTDKRTYPKDADGNSVSNTYTVRKIGDQCWMTQNLRIYNTTIKAADSDFEGEDIPLPNSTRSNFTSSDASKYSYQSYYNTDQTTSAKVNTTSYYNWYTATAGAGNSNVSTNNQSVNTSICPKGWTLPTGGTTSVAAIESTWTDFYRLFRNMDLGISTNSLSTTSYTSWSSKNGISDLAMVQTEKDTNDTNGKVIYNFLYTGYVNGGSLSSGTSYGYWWSSTAYSANSAYHLNVSSSVVGPGTYSNNRYVGFAVRCIARS